jgi:hypothetical protein
MEDPGDSMANYVWTHLFIYKDLEGTIPSDWSKWKRLRVGHQIQIPIDSGPTGKNVAGGYLDYAGSRGGNKVFTDSLLPEVKNVPLILTSSYLWDALGLPRTAFNDSRRKGTIRTVTEKDFQPYQYSVVQLHDKMGKPVTADGKPVEFFGTNPVDLLNCYLCHSGEGKAAKLARSAGLSLFDKEYAYWKNTYPDMTEFMARQSQTSINVLELHDKHFHDFLKEYNLMHHRTASAPWVHQLCDCHETMFRKSQTPRPGTTGYKAVKARALTEAIHTHACNVYPYARQGGKDAKLPGMPPHALAAGEDERPHGKSVSNS